MPLTTTNHSQKPELITFNRVFGIINQSRQPLSKMIDNKNYLLFPKTATSVDTALCAIDRYDIAIWWSDYLTPLEAKLTKQFYQDEFANRFDAIALPDKISGIEYSAFLMPFTDDNTDLYKKHYETGRSYLINRINELAPLKNMLNDPLVLKEFSLSPDLNLNNMPLTEQALKATTVDTLILKTIRDLMEVISELCID